MSNSPRFEQLPISFEVGRKQLDIASIAAGLSVDVTASLATIASANISHYKSSFNVIPSIKAILTQGSQSQGWITDDADLLPVINSDTYETFTDGDGDKIYAKITFTTVFEVLFFVNKNGVETAYTIPATGDSEQLKAGDNVSIAVKYLFNNLSKPIDLSQNFFFDVAGGGTGLIVNAHEPVTVTSINTFATLSRAPIVDDTTAVYLEVNGLTKFYLDSGAITVVGNALTYTPTALQNGQTLNILTTDKVRLRAPFIK